jgi:hypothetical protein
MHNERGWDENQVLLAARMVREHYFPHHAGLHSPEWILILAVRELLKSIPASSPEELLEILTTQSELASRGELSWYASSSMVMRLAAGLGETPSAVDVFRGGRKFSFAKLSAVVSFFTRRVENICAIKLNQLLFYSDFVNFYLRGRSVTGSRYVRESQGPVLHRFESILKTLSFTGVVKLRDASVEGLISVGSQSDIESLPLIELVSMNWVLVNLGSMTAEEISEYSHRESAYRFTRQDDFIAYEYAQLLQKLPGQGCSLTPSQ